MKTRLVALLLTLALGTRTVAYDWPQWRGPDRSGVSKETGLLKSWSKEGPKLLWTYKNAGLGFSSFAIVGGNLYTLGTRDDKDEVIIALDKGGKELWTAKIGPIFTFKGNVWGDGPRGTPTIDGKRLYALGGQGDLVCVDIRDKGKEIWRKNLIKDFDGEMMSEWGYSESPLVDGNVLVCTPGGEKGTMAALDKSNGNLVWQSQELKHKAPYSSIMPADIHGVPQYVQLSYVDDTVGGFANGIRAKDGELLWSMPIFKGHSYAAAPTPIVKDNLVYVTTGYGGGCHLFEIAKDFTVKDLFSKKIQKTVKNTHGGVVLIDGYLYGHSEGLGWVCQEMKKSGEVVWNEKNAFECVSGSITAADGMLYLYTDDGEVGLVEADYKEFKEISKFTIPEKSTYPQTRPTSRQSKVWTHPVIADGRLYLRDNEFIFCYDLKK
ncbi:MAG: PQQ-like beta-propeller repeat protein [Planctomycetes bacterium]|nr:PQQ-like beta-propeller repeat protein [Planctomycetota bacterium]